MAMQCYQLTHRTVGGNKGPQNCYIDTDSVALRPQVAIGSENLLIDRVIKIRTSDHRDKTKPSFHNW